MSEDVRLVAWVRGRVQGVGFRWFTRAKALEIGGLSGFALNLGDGRVQVVAEGSREGCAGLLDWLQGDDTPGRVEGVTEIRVRDPLTALREPPQVAPVRTAADGRPERKRPGGCQESRTVAGSADTTDRHVLRAPQESQRRRCPAARARVRPPIQGVIVLTVKLFGETLKAPRTLAVWHGATGE
jgi:acylphosphatase